MYGITMPREEFLPEAGQRAGQPVRYELITGGQPTPKDTSDRAGTANF
jgi:hypothetical protein